MKKLSFLLFALLFAMLMPLSSLSASADSLSPDESGASSGGTSLTVTTVAVSKPEFTVSIPGNIPIGALERTEVDSIKITEFSVGISNLTYLNGKAIEVHLSAPNGFYLYSGENRLPYKIYNTASGGTALTSGALFHSFTADGTQKGRLEINQKDIPAAGTYSGVITFTVEAVSGS